MEACQDSVPAAVYEDPNFTGTTRVTSENVDRLIDPGDAPKRSERTLSRYEGIEIRHSTGNTGRWWPVWLICRTKGGWWTISWDQLLDGDWVVEFWWYADVHVHLLDTVR